MKRFGFIGFGELGRQVLDLVRSGTSHGNYLYFDDICHGQGLAGALPIARFADDEFVDTHFFVCLGYKHLKKNSRLLTV